MNRIFKLVLFALLVSATFTCFAQEEEDDPGIELLNSITDPISLASTHYNNGVMTINLNQEVDKSCDCFIRIISVFDGECISAKLSQQHCNLNTGTLSSGMYIIALYKDGIEIDSKKYWVK